MEIEDIKRHGNYGKKRSEEFKRKVSNGHKGKTPKNINMIAGWNRGMKSKDYRPNYKHSEETRRKISMSNKGKIMSEEARLKMSLSKKGKSPWNKGKKGLQKAWNKGIKSSFEWRNKLRQAKIGKTKEMANNWQGGLSYEPYTIDWTNTLKKSIRERDHYTCKICKCEGYPIHHIDYNKKNCDPENLVCLCLRCHSKTNNNRERWMEYFKELMGRNNGKSSC